MRFLRKSPVQTFLLLPLAVLLFELALGPLRIQPAGALLMLWGYAQYRLVGRYRVRLGAGGPGLSGAPPERLVESGVYRWTRNPMYLGHMLYMIGVAVLFQSWFGTAVAIARALWFHRRVLDDEKRLADLFGQPYAGYTRRVRRWLPRLL